MAPITKDRRLDQFPHDMRDSLRHGLHTFLCMTGHHVNRLTGLLLGIAFGISSVATALEQPGGAVILTVSGNTGVTNVGVMAQFDLALLQSLPVTTF